MLVLFVALCLLAGAVGGIVTGSSVETWYPDLKKPVWTPPSFVFGPIWTLLYLLMGVSGWMVWRRRENVEIPLPMVLFGVQLTLNVAWSLVFFGLRQPGLAALEIVLLWLAIAANLWAFARVSRAAAWLLVPYLAWVSFAMLLNVAIWRLNV
jgi:tryptophan-rich sensory protein